MVRCTRYNIMWSSLSVTCGRSVVFFTIKADNITDILLKVTLHIIILTLCNQFLSPLQLWVSEWLLFSGNSAIFQVYHGENKLIFNEMMMRSTLYKTNTRSWIFVVLAQWSTSLRIDRSPNSDTLTWFRSNQYLLFLLNDVCLEEKQQIQIA
jgi:hypothetical protein